MATQCAVVVEAPSQTRLAFRRQVIDMLQEQHPAARTGVGAIGAEYFRIDLRRTQACNACRHERPARLLAVFVQCARDTGLARAALALDQHRKIGIGDLGDGAKRLLHCRRAPDKRQVLIARRFLDRSAHRRVGATRQRTAHASDEGVEIEWFRHVVEGARIGR